MDEEVAKEVRHKVTLTVRAEEQKTPKASGLNRINAITATTMSIVKVFAILVIVVFLVFNLDLLKDLMGRVRHVELFGVKLDVDSAAHKIIEQTRADDNGPKVSLDEAEGALKRAIKSADVFAYASILWIDDHPENNIALRRVFQDLGSSITVAMSTDEAAHALRRIFFDVVISDIARPEGDGIAIAFTKQVAEIPNAPAFIFYVGRLDSRNPPDGAFAITNRPDELLKLVTDVLERRFHTR